MICLKMAASRMLMALAISATMVVELAMATNYTVGDSDGWELGGNFQSWASSKNFTVGDVLSEYSFFHVCSKLCVFDMYCVVIANILVSIC